MIIRKADPQTEAGIKPSEAMLRDMLPYNAAMATAGVLRSGDGLQPTAKGARITFSKGKPKVVDGPFAEAKELIAGFTMMEVASREEALEWVKRWPTSDGNGNVGLELRQVYEIDELGEAVTPELKAQEARLRAEGVARQQQAPTKS